MFQKLASWIRAEPVLIAWTMNGGLAALFAFVFHLSTPVTAAIVTLTTACASVFTALRTKPVPVSALAGTLTTIATACEAFGLHLPANWVAAGVASLSTVLGLILRSHLTPVAAPVATVTPLPPPAPVVVSTVEHP